MKKKQHIIWFLNVMAFGSILATVYSECGGATFAKILIPSAIMFGSQWGLYFALIKKEDKDNN